MTVRNVGARSSTNPRGAGRAPQPRPSTRPALTSTFANAPQPRPSNTHTPAPHHPRGGARGARPEKNPKIEAPRRHP